MSSTAFAVVNLDDGTGSVNYASQLVVAGTTALTGAGINATSTLGFGVSNTQTRYVRYDLGNAVFANARLAADLTVPTATTTVAQGGAAGSSFVIFQITATNNIDQAAAVAFALGTGGVPPAPPAVPGVVIQSANAPVTLTYSLYEDAPSAAAGGAAGRLASRSATVAGVVSGLAFSAVPNTTTVSVNANPTYTKFLPSGNNTTDVLAQVGTVSIGAAPLVLNPNTGNPVAYNEIVAAGTKLILRGGDLTTAVSPTAANAGLFLAGGGSCAAAGLAGTQATRTATSVEFATGANAQANVPVCYSVPGNNTAAIITQDFTIEADITPAAGSTAADLTAIAAGKFQRDGLVLKAAFSESTTAAGVSTAVSLSNTTGSAAPYTVRCLLNNGSVAGTPGTVPANTAVRLGLTQSLGCPSNGTLRALEITFARPPGSVIGSIVRQNTSTGQASYDGMTGNQ
jgi:hypothetical protein